MDPRLLDVATRIAEALERLAPPPPPPLDLDAAEAFVWSPDPARLVPVTKVARVPIALLQGVERQKRILLENTSASPPAAPPTTPCCGARAGWASPRWSRRCTPR